MRLESIVDLEVQIALDRAASPDELRRRDLPIFREIPEDAPTPRLLTQWLNRLKARGVNPGLGARVAAGFRWARRLLVVAGLLAGAGTAAALLDYGEGQPPVNVGTFLLVAVGAQLSLLVLFLVGWPIVRLFPDAPLFGDVRSAWVALARGAERISRAAESSLAPRWREQLEPLRGRLRSRASLYGDVERWTAVGMSQALGVAFNVGLVAGCLRLVVLSDLAFGWSTTADALDAAAMHRITQTLAVPWAGTFPTAVPSAELIEASQYRRLEGRYVFAEPGSKGDADLVGDWWPFLLAATLTYGLAPRVALALLAAGMSARARRRLDSPEVERILRRARSLEVSARGTGHDAPPRGGRANPSSETAPAAAPPAGACLAIVWRDADAPSEAVDAALAAEFGWAVEARVAAASAEDLADLDPGSKLPVLLAEAWEPPDKGVLRALRALRAGLGASRPIWVVLLGPRRDGRLGQASPEDVALWRDRVDALGDGYVGVDALGAT